MLNEQRREMLWGSRLTARLTKSLKNFVVPMAIGNERADQIGLFSVNNGLRCLRARGQSFGDERNVPPILNFDPTVGG